MTLELALTAIAGAVLFAWLIDQERRHITTSGLGVVLAVVIADAIIHPVFEQPAGIFHPSIGGQSFRLPEIVIPLVLAARFTGRGLPSRLSTPTMWWLAFAAWYSGSAIVGYFAGNSIDVIFFEAKAVVYVVGGLAVAAGVPSDALLERLPIWLRRAAAACVVLLVLALAGKHINVRLPLVPLVNFGKVGGDAATVFAGLGILGLVIAAGRRDRRRAWLLVAAPMLFAPLLAEQRAALLGLAVSFVVIAVLWALPIGQRGLAATPSELTVLAVVVVGVVALFTFVPAAVQQHAARPPLLGDLQTTFLSEGKLQSAESRQNQWTAAMALIRVHPVMGWGLGKKYRHYEQGPDTFLSTDITHNVPLDVIVRSGMIGCALLSVAVAASVRAAVLALRRAAPPVVALLVGGLAFVAAILTKGLVESVLEKYLLATMLGLVLGVLHSAVASTRTPEQAVQWSEVGSSWS